jgi:hypothetical protein
MQNFSTPASTQMDLDNFLTFFQEKFRIFQENTEAKFQKSPKSSKIPACQLAKHVHAKFQLHSFYPD